MDIAKFNKLSEALKPVRYLVWQDWAEWQFFLEFVSAYFKSRGIDKPLVVEIGILHNEQQVFYRKLLGAGYIGIDIEANNEPDILGNSSDLKTVSKLRKFLKNREIDLLFIDGSHSYEGVKTDYELYGVLTKHLIAFHDVHSVLEDRALGVNRYWNEIVRRNQYMTAVFHRYNTSVSIKENRYMNEGIGVVIKG